MNQVFLSSDLNVPQTLAELNRVFGIVHKTQHGTDTYTAPCLIAFFTPHSQGEVASMLSGNAHIAVLPSMTNGRTLKGKEITALKKHDPSVGAGDSMEKAMKKIYAKRNMTDPLFDPDTY